MGLLVAIHPPRTGGSEGRPHPSAALQGSDKSPSARPEKGRPALQSSRIEAVQAATREKVESIAGALERYIQINQRDLHIRIHEGTGKIMVQVISSSDGKVIREIPPEEWLNLAAKIDEMVGVLFNRKA